MRPIQFQFNLNTNHRARELTQYRQFIINGTSYTHLVGSVEACLLHRLRKRALGLFKNSTTSALLVKVSKTFEPASKVHRLMKEYEKNEEASR